MVLKRIRSAVETANAAVEPIPAVSSETTSDKDKKKVARALIHLGSTEVLGNSLALHLVECREHGYRCVVISNHFPARLLDRSEVIFEYLPVGAISVVHSGPDHMYIHLFERLAHILTFWSVGSCSWSGDKSQEILGFSKKYAPDIALLTDRR